MNKSRHMAGSVTLVLLTVLEREELYGYDIALRLEALDDEILSLGEGTIYPTLHEMEKAGLVDSHEGTGRRGRRVRFYRITPKGRKQLKAMRASWKKVTEAVTQFVFAHA